MTPTPTRRGCYRALASALLAVAWLVVATGQTPPSPNPHRIAVFGSSVANGTGDFLGREGYAGRLREMMAPRGWEVVNQSRGGDNTVRMAPRFDPAGAPQPNTKYLLPANPRYALLGLSLGNEGIANVETKVEKDAVFAQFESGLKALIARSRQHDIVPIVTSCYTRMDFTPVEYEYTRRMNLLINSWDVPSVNFLGAVDDGTGKWAKGFWFDALHPNPAGHDELTATFVPTLFEAIEQGKPLPTRSTAAGFARASGGVAPIAFSPAETMHPFAMAVSLRAQSDGVAAAVTGVMLDPQTTRHRIERAGRGATEIEYTTLLAGQPFTATVSVLRGAWAYTSSTGRTIVSTVKADGAWHSVVVSHYTARGETLFFVDGQLAGTTPERLQPKRFAIGGPASAGAGQAPKQTDMKDLLIYRSALNADEVAALQKGTLLQSSLEVLAPLADSNLEAGAALENRAQSLTRATVVATSGLVHREK